MSGSPRKSGAPYAPRFGRDVPRAVQAIVRVALDNLARPIPGERGRMRRVEGGMARLTQAAGHDAPSTTWRQVSTAEELGLMRRSGATLSRQVYVLATHQDIVAAELRANVHEAACACCGDPVTEAYEQCRRCSPASRKDRAWKQTAINLLHEGRTLPSIAALVGQPLYPAAGDGPLVGVVANLLAEVPHMVPVAFREGYKEAIGEEYTQVWSALASRARQRRHRRTAE